MKRSRNMLIVLIMLLAMIAGTLGAAVPLVQSTAQNQMPVERVREVVALRETNSETYLLSNGNYECVVYAGDKYYRDSRNALKLIDNTLILDEATAKTENRHYKNTANSFQVTFSDSDTPTVTMTKDHLGITFRAESASGGSPFQTATSNKTVTVGAVRNCDTLTQLTDTGTDTITYANAFYNTDLVYVLQNNALKEYIVLKNANAPNAITFRFSMEGLTLEESDGVGVFLDEDNNEVFRLDRLFALDGNGVMTEELTYTFASVKGSRDILVTVTLDAEYLAEEDRAFPVVIDPSVMISSAQTADASVYSGYPNTNYQMEKRLRTGKDTTYGVRHTYIQFEIPRAIYGKPITSASLDLKKHSGSTPYALAYMCKSYWHSGTITWNYKPDKESGYISSLSFPRSSGSAWYRMDVTSIVASWTSLTEGNYGFIVRDAIENDTDQWTTFYSSDAPSPNKPELHITYIGDEINTEPEETTPTSKPESSIPQVHLYLFYDYGYSYRYPDATARAIRISNAIVSYFESNFIISISAGSPYCTTSYADECLNPDIFTDTTSFNSLCCCVYGDECGNTDYTYADVNGDGKIEENEVTKSPTHTYHHTNLYNITCDIVTPDMPNATKLLLTGHKTCYREPGSILCAETSACGLYGVAYFPKRICAVSNLQGEEKETITAIHEFGHLLGMDDHYTPQTNSDFSDHCLYGLEWSDFNSVNDIQICSGCRAELESTVNKYYK